MPDILEPPVAPPKPAATPAPATKPAAAKPEPKVDPLTISAFKPTEHHSGVPDDQNPFFALEEKRKGGADEPEPVKEDKAADAPPKAEDKPAVDDAEEKAKAERDAKTIKPKTEIVSGGQLRTKLETALKEVDGYKAKITEYETKLKDAKPSEEVTKLAETNAELARQVESLKGELVAKSEGVTPEFKQKWEEPFNREYKNTLRLLKQLPVTENGQTRAGTDADLQALYALPYAQAFEAAEKVFGEKHAIQIMHHHAALHAINDDYTEALESEKKTWKETEAKRTAEQVKHREAFSAGLETARKALVDKYPTRFQADPNDPEEAKWLAEGKNLLTRKPDSFERHVFDQAARELAVIAHPKLVYQLEKTQKALAEATEKLKEYEKSEPGTSKRKTQVADSPVDDEEDDRRRFKATK